MRAWLRLACAAALVATGCRSVERFLAPRVANVQIPLVFDRPVELVPPESLQVRSSADRQIVLAWSPVLVGNVAGYAILRALDASGPFKLVGRTQSRFGTVYTDQGETEGSLGDGQTYHYRVHPYDALGRVSRSHAAIAATTEPAPAMPSDLTAYSNLPRKVVLTWDPSPGGVAAYAVYRSPTAAGPYERVAEVRGRLNTVYEDSVDGDLRVMYYRISALNRFGGESERTEAERAVTKAEPLPPIDLRVQSRELGALALAWTPNVETDLRAYEVWRSERSPDGWTPEHLIAEVEVKPSAERDPPDTLAWIDPTIGCGQPVRYRLRARDRDGLQSDFSPPLETIGQDLGLEIASTGSSVELRWDPDRALGFQRARIELERAMGLPPRILGSASDEPRFALPADLDGTARLRVVLETSVDGADGNAHAREAPPCTITVSRSGGQLKAEGAPHSAGDAPPRP
jgi:fibronectin type 3 domain-containing protein